MHQPRNLGDLSDEEVAVLGIRAGREARAQFIYAGYFLHGLMQSFESAPRVTPKPEIEASSDPVSANVKHIRDWSDRRADP